MSRITRHQMFMMMAEVAAKRSTCFRESVGAIIVRNNRVVSIGYNGPKAGADPCTHHPDGQCQDAIHAEENAIRFIQGKPAINCDLYCTHLPCTKCVGSIITSGLFKRVFFTVVYGDAKIVENLFDKYGIKLIRVLPSGVLTTPDRTRIITDVEA